MGAHRYKELSLWNKAIALAEYVYEVSSHFPKSEQFGLFAQVRRCVVSISSNIAEGAGRNTNKEFDHFLSIARGSLYELETQLIISKRLSYISEEKLDEINLMLTEIDKMIFALKKTLS
jgi:four helix bundle protein